MFVSCSEWVLISFGALRTVGIGTLTLYSLVPSHAWTIAGGEVLFDEDITQIIEDTSLTMQLEVSKESPQELSLSTVASSVVGACVFSALILFVVLLGVGLRVWHKRKQCRSQSSGDHGESICTWLTSCRST